MKNKSKIGLIIGGVIVALIVILATSIVSSYNGIVTMKENVDKKYADINVQLERRLSLIPNLVSTVKGYASHEEEIIQSISDARSKLSAARTTSEKAEANEELTSALNNLMVIVENYPDLKANENFKQLSDELAGTENRIAVARRDYNEAAQEYNTKIIKMPTNIIASIFNFEKVEYFNASEKANETPTVSFE